MKRIQLAVMFTSLLICSGTYAGNVNSIAPIHISGDSGFPGCGCATLVGGTWVIVPRSITSSSGDGVFIENVTVPFVLQNMTVNKSAGAGIHFRNVNLTTPTTVVMGVQSSIQSNQIGILVETSRNLILDGGGSNPSGWGIAANGVAGTINKNYIGAVNVENSSWITVKGWQLSANGQDGTPDWLAFDPGFGHWNVGGVRFFNVTNSVIDHNSANNDTSISYSLFSSSSNRVTWNTGDYPFSMNILITGGSSNNLIDHNLLGTADFIGVLVADPLSGATSTHSNTISNNYVHSSGPTGNEAKAGVVPDFIGGIVLLNSTSSNRVTGNQLWANSGTDLKWAQETLDPNSQIGVRTFPNAAVCNVSNAVAFNDNVWTGNSFTTEDICPGNVPLQP